MKTSADGRRQVKTILATVRFTVQIPIDLEDWELSRLEEGIDHLNEITDRDLLAEAKAKVPDLKIDDVDLDWEHADEVKGMKRGRPKMEPTGAPSSDPSRSALAVQWMLANPTASSCDAAAQFGITRQAVSFQIAREGVRDTLAARIPLVHAQRDEIVRRVYVEPMTLRELTLATKAAGWDVDQSAVRRCASRIGIKFTFGTDALLLAQCVEKVRKGASSAEARHGTKFGAELLRTACDRAGITLSATPRGRKTGRALAAWKIYETGVRPLSECARRASCSAASFYEWIKRNGKSLS